MRQFDQIGVEVLGSYDALADAETILLALRFFERIGLDGCKLKLNSFGCPKCRPAYREALLRALREREERLCRRCRQRMGRNVFRVLDCKEESCKAATEGLPAMRDFLDDECREHFDKVLEALNANGVEYTLDDRLVRGLDYYTRTVYEIAHPSLGARDAVCGGGRYDGLAEELGGPPIGGVGFAIGVVPTILALNRTKAEGTGGGEGGVRVFVSAVTDEDRGKCFEVVNRLRRNGIAAEMDYEGRSIKAQMRSANRLGVRFVVIIGPDERASGNLKLKDMSSGEEVLLREDEAIGKLKNELGTREG